MNLFFCSKTFHSNYNLIKCNIPEDIIKDIPGEILFERSSKRVSPITNFPIKEINDNAHILVFNSSKICKNHRIIQEVILYTVYK